MSKVGITSAPRPGKSSTYILFTKKGRGLSKIIGPVFGSDIELMKQKFFQADKTVHVLEELVFMSHYQSHYHNHIKQFWMDKLYTYFALNVSWIGAVRLDVQNRGFTGAWFTMFEAQHNGELVIQIQFDVNANKFYPPRLLVEMQVLIPIRILPKEEYYAGSNQVLYTGHLAVRRQLAETLINQVCLS